MATVSQNLTRIRTKISASYDELELLGAEIPEVKNINNLPDSIKSLGQAIDKKPIEFIDYDGTEITSYTFEEALSLTELPPCSDKPGYGSGYTLVNQGWNYTLAEVKSNAQAGINTTVGCSYVTSDGATRIHIHIDDPNDTTFGFVVAQKTSRTMGIMFGDPNDTSDDQTSVGSISAVFRSHTYSSAGDFTIKIYPTTSGNKTIRFQKSICDTIIKYCDMVVSVELGLLDQFYGSTSTGGPFSQCNNITSVAIPSGITEYIGTAAFMNNTKLKAVVIPKPATSSPIKAQCFDNCASLEKVSIPPLVSMIGTNTDTAASGLVFENCPKLEYVSIPSTVTDLGKNAFDSCGSLKSVYWNGTAVLHGNAFNRCLALENIELASGTQGANVLVGGSDFYGCGNLKSVTCSTPISATGDSCFQSCVNLGSVPEVVNVSNNMFNECVSLRNVKVSYKYGAITLPFTFISKGDNCYTYTITTASTLTGGASSGQYAASSFTVSDFTSSSGVYIISNSNQVLEINANTGTIRILNSSLFTAAIATSTSRTIGNYAFRYSGLNVIDFSDSTMIPGLGSGAFNNMVSGYTIVVPDGQLAIWQSATGWTSVSSHMIEAQ